MRRPWALPRVLVFLALSIAAPPALAAETCVGEAWVESTLYLGRGMAEGGGVGDAEVQAFVDETIVPRFPDGFTLFDARGHWRDSATGRGVGERTVVFVVAHPPGPGADDALRSIADAYIARFDQSAVLRTDQPVCATFYERR